MELERAKTIKLNRLLAILLVIFLLALAALGMQYYLGNRLLGNDPKLLPAIPPKYLYSLYEGSNKFAHPLGVTVNQQGTIYVTNNSVHTVEVIAADGRNKQSFGKQGALPGQFMYPYGIGVLPDGNLVVAETGNFRVQILSAKGSYLGTLIEPNNKQGIHKPGPICVDSRGHIYIGDLVGSQVVEMDQSGQVFRRIGDIQYPHGIAVDEKNRKLYISDAGRVSVKVFSLDKQDNQPVAVIKEFSPGKAFSMVRGLAVDKLGRLYVADTIVDAVRVFDQAGRYLFSFGHQGFRDGEFKYPDQIFVDNLNRIYLTDLGNARVQVWGN